MTYLKKQKKEKVDTRDIDTLNKDELYLYLKSQTTGSRNLRKAICVKYMDANDYDWFNEEEVDSLISFTIANCIARVEYDRMMNKSKKLLIEIIENHTDFETGVVREDNLVQLDFFHLSGIKGERHRIIKELESIVELKGSLNKFENCTKEDGKNSVRNSVINKMNNAVELAVKDTPLFIQMFKSCEDLDFFDIWERDNKIQNLFEFKRYFMASIWNAVTKHYNKYKEDNFNEDGGMLIELSAPFSDGKGSNGSRNSAKLLIDTVSEIDKGDSIDGNLDGMESVNLKIHLEAKMKLLYPLLKKVEVEILEDLLYDQLTIDEICLKREFSHRRVQQIKREIFNKINQMELYNEVA